MTDPDNALVVRATEIVERADHFTNEKAMGYLSEAERYLSMASDVTELIDLRDSIACLMPLFHLARIQFEVEQHATLLRLKTQRRIGEWLSLHVRAGRPTTNITLDQIGLTKSESSRLQRIASIPVAKFDGYIDEKISLGHDLTVGGLLKYADAIWAHGPQATKLPSAATRDFGTDGRIWLTAPEGTCALEGYAIRCGRGVFHRHHIVSMNLARGNDEVHAILKRYPEEVIGLICPAHNTSKWADTPDARRVLLLQNIWRFGWSRMRAFVNGLPWKVHHPELTLEAMLDAE